MQGLGNVLRVAVLAGCLGGVVRPAAVAQAVGTPHAAYEGPRYPGGPDSLRAYLRRHPLPGGAPTFVQFNITPTQLRAGQPRVLAAPARPEEPGLAAAAAAALDGMPAFAPGRQDVPVPITTLTLGFNLPPGAPAYAYADEMPVFAGFEPGILGLYEHLPAILVITPEILRRKLNGEVYVYLEVSETGRVEQVRVLEGRQPALNQAALQTIARLPERALRPAQLGGRPVRIYYVLSLVYDVP